MGPLFLTNKKITDKIEMVIKRGRVFYVACRGRVWKEGSRGVLEENNERGRNSRSSKGAVI